MSLVGRRDHGDGEEPAYVFASPCCGALETVSAWLVRGARLRPDRTLRLRCGRTATDALRPAGAVGRHGCGQWFVEDVSEV